MKGRALKSVTKFRHNSDDRRSSLDLGTEVGYVRLTVLLLQLDLLGLYFILDPKVSDTKVSCLS